MTKASKRIVGSGITARRKDLRLTFGPKSDDEVLAFFRERQRTLNSPWGAQRKLIQAARAKLAEILGEAPKIDRANSADKLRAHNEFFLERVSVGWYVNAIDVAATVAEIAVEQNRPWEAVVMGIEIGELFAEMRFKEIWEEAALFGDKRMGELHDGAQKRRTQPAGQRYRKVEEYRLRGWNFERAYKSAAKDFGVSPSTVKQDYLRQRKLDNPMD